MQIVPKAMINRFAPPIKKQDSKISCIRGDKYGVQGFDARLLYVQKDVQEIRRDEKISCRVIIESKTQRNSQQTSPVHKVNSFKGNNFSNTLPATAQ